MKFLFFSPHALADSCSGAARCVQVLLEALNAAGHHTRALTGAITDGPGALFEKILGTKPARVLSVQNGVLTVPVRKLRLRGVEHAIAGSKATAWDEYLAYDDVVLRELFLETWEQFQPDVLLTYGGYASNVFAGQYARRSGRRSVLFAASDSYRKASDFHHIGSIATVSQALAANLRRVTEAPVLVLSSLVQRDEVRAKTRTPEYITFINPIPAKGVKVAAAIASACQAAGRPYKFLFVESRGTRLSALRDCPELKDLKNVSFAANTADIRTVYARTRILLYPSLWFETAGQTPIEANANGIPVLASDNGGIAEMLDGAGFLFKAPDDLRANWLAPPPAGYIAEWVTTLDRLHDDPAARDDALARASTADARYDIGALAAKFADFCT